MNKNYSLPFDYQTTRDRMSHLRWYEWVGLVIIDLSIVAFVISLFI